MPGLCAGPADSFEYPGYMRRARWFFERPGYAPDPLILLILLSFIKIIAALVKYRTVLSPSVYQAIVFSSVLFQCGL
jgi:hypothetical protein